jgi:hypothetical protein
LISFNWLYIKYKRILRPSKLRTIEFKSWQHNWLPSNICYKNKHIIKEMKMLSKNKFENFFVLTLWFTEERTQVIHSWFVEKSGLELFPPEIKLKISWTIRPKGSSLITWTNILVLSLRICYNQKFLRIHIEW